MKRNPNALPKLSADAERSLSSAARYVYRMRRFDRFYLTLVICMGAVVALAIVVAVVANVLVGLCAAIAVAVLYSRFKKDALHRMLRLSCSAAVEGLCITSLFADGDGVLYVPDRLMGLCVTALGDAPFAKGGNEAVTVLYLPDTLTAIGPNALTGLDALEKICFAGTPDAWERIEKPTDLSGLTVEYGVAYPDCRILPLDVSATDGREADA